MIGGLAAALGRVLSTPARRAIAGAVAAALLLAAVIVLGGGDDGPDVATDAPTTAPSTTVGTTTTTASTVPEAPSGLRFLAEDPGAPGVPAPLTGLPMPGDTAGRPAISVKVDNLDAASATARPQAGLAQADVVVEQLVEGGITRFVAVLHSTDAADVGPVRSARTTDIDLVPMFGRSLFAYSGGNGGVLAAVRASDRFVERGGGGAPAYHRVSDRRAPHNLFLRPAELWARPGDAAAPPALGPFAATPAAGDAIEGVSVSWSGAASVGVSWVWSVGDARWVRHQRGTVHVAADGYAVGPRNVILMFVEYRPSAVDARSPEAVTVGSGEAWVLRDGRLVRGRWQRADGGAPLTIVDDAGTPVALTPGRTWIELVAPGGAVVDA